MTTETISRTDPTTATAETINRTHPTTETAKIINRTGPAWETAEEFTPKDPKSYMGLIFARDWQTHLPPSPEGQLLASADFCPESGDIAHFILDPKSREIIIACFDSCFNEPEELCYFLKQENGLMAPVTKAQSRKALDRLNANTKIEWSYPPYTKGQPKPKRYRPMGPGLTPDLGDMFDDHEWHTQSRRKFNEDVQSSYFCGICLAQMHTTCRNIALTRAWVRLPGMRQCYYLRTENAISPVSDTDFYGAEPLRISREQLDAQEKGESQSTPPEKVRMPPGQQDRAGNPEGGPRSVNAQGAENAVQTTPWKPPPRKSQVTHQHGPDLTAKACHASPNLSSPPNSRSPCQRSAPGSRQPSPGPRRPTAVSPAFMLIWTATKPESTEGGGRVSALKRQEGAPVLLG